MPIAFSYLWSLITNVLLFWRAFSKWAWIQIIQTLYTHFDCCFPSLAYFLSIRKIRNSWVWFDRFSHYNDRVHRKWSRKIWFYLTSSAKGFRASTVPKYCEYVQVCIICTSPYHNKNRSANRYEGENHTKVDALLFKNTKKVQLLSCHLFCHEVFYEDT